MEIFPKIKSDWWGSSVVDDVGGTNLEKSPALDEPSKA